MGFVFLRFWKDQRELVSAVARRGVNGAAVNAQNIGDTADGAAAYKMAVTVVNGLQTTEVQKQHGKRTAGTVGAIGFVFQNVEQTAILGNAREAIADRQVEDAVKEKGSVEKSAAKKDGVAKHNRAV